MATVSETVQLLETHKMPTISGLHIPRDFYWVLLEPAPLAGMRAPWTGLPWGMVHDSGFRGVICLTNACQAYDPAPLSRLAIVGLQDLYGGGFPDNQVREEQLVQRVARLAWEQISKGAGVVVHCEGGRGRTGTVIGCVLRMMGVSSEQVISYLDTLHKRRGKDGWPESSWQADVVRRCPTTPRPTGT
jgi:hypothetical protein